MDDTEVDGGFYRHLEMGGQDRHEGAQALHIPPVCGGAHELFGEASNLGADLLALNQLSEKIIDLLISRIFLKWLLIFFPSFAQKP